MPKTKVKKRLNVRKLIIMLLGIYLITMICYYLFTLPIKNKIILGNNILTDEEILKNASIDDSVKLLTLNSNSLKKLLEENPLIEECSIKKYINGTLKISIKEAKVLFYDTTSQVYFLSNNKELNNKNILGVPSLINYVPKETLDNFIKKMGEIDTNIIGMISEIEYNPDIKNDVTIDAYRFILRMNDGNTVYINIANFLKLNKYAEIYSTLTEKGELFLDSNRKGVVFLKYKEG